MQASLRASLEGLQSLDLSSFSFSMVEVQVLLRLFPCEVSILASKVTEGSSLLEYGALQLQLLHDLARSEVEVVVDDV